MNRQQQSTDKPINRQTVISEYECICGYVWLDDQNHGCPMCGNYNDVIRRDYVIPQPESFAHRQEQGD